MKSFKLNETDILSNQDWTFPTNIAYGPGRLKEIGSICNNLDIKNPLIVTDKGSPKLPFIINLLFKFLKIEKCSFVNRIRTKRGITPAIFLKTAS